jgi:hypothetical protein
MDFPQFAVLGREPGCPAFGREIGIFAALATVSPCHFDDARFLAAGTKTPAINCQTRAPFSHIDSQSGGFFLPRISTISFGIRLAERIGLPANDWMEYIVS